MKTIYLAEIDLDGYSYTYRLVSANSENEAIDIVKKEFGKSTDVEIHKCLNNNIN